MLETVSPLSNISSDQQREGECNQNESDTKNTLIA